MSLNQEQTQFLLNLLNKMFTELSNLRSSYTPTISTLVSRHLDKDLNDSLSTCLHLKSLLAVVVIDADFVSGMLPKDFDMLQGFIGNHVRHLKKQLKALGKVDADFSLEMKPSFEKRIAFIEGIQSDLNTMFSSSISTV